MRRKSHILISFAYLFILPLYSVCTTLDRCVFIYILSSYPLYYIYRYVFLGRALFTYLFHWDDVALRMMAASACVCACVSPALSYDCWSSFFIIPATLINDGIQWWQFIAGSLHIIHIRGNMMMMHRAYWSPEIWVCIVMTPEVENWKK